MIVRRFLHWMRTAPAGERAAATNALARAYLYSDLSDDDRAAAERAMTVLVDDPSPLVRQALAAVLAASPLAPHAVIHALAADHRDIAAHVLAHSPLFIDAELVDFVATSGAVLQAAIASRAPLQCAVAAAIAEVGAPEACLVAIENRHADIAPSSFRRIIDRFGHLGALREALFACPDLPLAARQTLLRQLSNMLVDFVSQRDWMARERAERVAREACEKATITIAASGGDDSKSVLIRHLRVSGQLTTGFALRALLSGNIGLFEATLAELSGLPLHRVQALIRDRGSAGFRAVFDRAGLPHSCYAAFREAMAALREAEANGECFGGSRLQRRVVERVLANCKGADPAQVEPLLILLRRFAAEAAREDAYVYCEQLTDGTADEERAAA
jgi:uncharacterized protein (DUF2336 family)